jgi:protein-L-isoaspartate(D-aspartate) O-methyltransferase
MKTFSRDSASRRVSVEFGLSVPHRWNRLALLLGAWAATFGAGPRLLAQTREEFDRARERMVSEYLVRDGIKNPRVLAAMRRVPRHEFVPSSERSHAYDDSGLLIGHKQTITWPFIVAFMTQALDPQPTDRVLEIGTGSGYQAAVLSLLVDEVYTIEIIPALGKSAERRLKHLRYRNVKTKIGDGYLGWPNQAPFDKIILTCSPEKIPQPLIDQLKEGGRMILPLGDRYDQAMTLIEKKHGRIERQELMPTLFVPMTGRSDKERTIKFNPLHPEIRNGGFEERETNGPFASWYYQLQVKANDRDAPEGRLCAEFQNEEPGRRSQVLQGMGIDGARIGALKISLQCRSDKITDGRGAFEKAGLQVSFHNFRKLLGDFVAIHCAGSTDWRTPHAVVPVPEAASEIVIRVGLNGATGRLLIDDVKLEPEPR